MSFYQHFIENDSIKSGTKVMFATFPADGHFNPLAGLAVYLKNLGCDVRWYTSKTFEEKIKQLDIPFYGLKKALDISADASLDNVFPERRKYKSQVSKLRYDLVNLFVLRSPEYYEDLQNIHKEFPFEIMVADITFGGISFVKEKMNIPVISIGVVPLIETSKDLPPSGLGLTPSYTFFGRLKQQLLRLVADKMLFAQPTKVMHDLLGSYGIDCGKANVFDILIQKSTVVLQSGTPGFEYSRSDLSGHIHFAGPLLPYQKKKEAPKWHHPKLDQYDKILLVTQGTVEKDIEKLLIPALEAFKGSDCLVVATTGGSQTKELQEKYPHKNIIIEDFIPFDDIMPYADVYISNGGYGGVLLAVQNGLPMVVGGVHEGKNEINARVGFFRLGINLHTEKPSVLQLRKSVEEVLQNEEYAQNTVRLKREFARYNPGEIIAAQVSGLLRKKGKQKFFAEEENVYAN